MIFWSSLSRGLSLSLASHTSFSGIVSDLIISSLQSHQSEYSVSSRKIFSLCRRKGVHLISLWVEEIFVWEFQLLTQRLQICSYLFILGVFFEWLRGTFSFLWALKFLMQRKISLCWLLCVILFWASCFFFFFAASRPSKKPRSKEESFHIFKIHQTNYRTQRKHSFVSWVLSTNPCFFFFFSFISGYQTKNPVHKVPRTPILIPIFKNISVHHLLKEKETKT